LDLDVVDAKRRCRITTSGYLDVERSKVMGKWFAELIRNRNNPQPVGAASPALKSAGRWAAVIVGLPIFPVIALSQRGLTHEATCIADVATPFSVMAVPNDDPIVSSAMVLERDAPIPKACEGVDFAPQISPRGAGQVMVLLPITNTTTVTWRASVLLKVNDDTTTVAVGPIKPGGTTVEKVLVRIPVDETTITAQLVIGP
jgi:hypothetical protein